LIKSLKNKKISLIVSFKLNNINSKLGIKLLNGPFNVSKKIINATKDNKNTRICLKKRPKE